MNNFIIEFKNALAPEFCQKLINKFELSQDKVAGRTGDGVDKSKKDSVDLYLSNSPQWQEEAKNISEMVLKATVEYVKQYPLMLTGAISPSMKDPVTGEQKTIHHDDIGRMNNQQIEHLVKHIYRIDEINMQRYTKGVGGYHHWHSEHFVHPSDPKQRSLHRVLLLLIYLNDVKEGGETQFFYQNAQVTPTQGSIVLAPCGFTHSHRGSIPVSNDKYVLASWIMFNEKESLYNPI